MQSTHTVSNSHLPRIKDDIFDYLEYYSYENVYFKVDKKTGLKAIIAIHSTKRGPTLGGCRCMHYPNTIAALKDAVRLSRAMTYKAALAGVPHGGGKAVLLAPDKIVDRRACFTAFARFVNQLDGRYITAEDSGTSMQDMDIIAEHTPYVAGTTKLADPSPYTAIGVFLGIRAAVKFKLGKDDLKGVHVAVQGLGNVGYDLVGDLHEAGAKITVADINEAVVAKCVAEFNVDVVAADDIYKVDCDVFTPCALGAVINEETIPLLKAKIIAGSANNQLDHNSTGEILHKNNILYVPDYVINAGGLIHAAIHYAHGSDAEIRDKIKNKYKNN